MENLSQRLVMLPAGVTVRSSTGEHYVIERQLGKGEMGAVYLVRSRVPSKNRLFALKEVIRPNMQDRERFAFDGNILKRLHHRALPRVHHIFENYKLERVYILMDYIDGENLETLRKKEEQARFALPLVLVLMAPIVDALIYLHSQNPPIVHRDIKPANVIIPVEADGAKLVDFGSAKEYQSTSTATVTARQSPGYASPEQYTSGTDPRTDVYGLGATFYTLLTGHIPFAATQRLTRTWNEASDPLHPVHELVPDIPEAVSLAIQRAMALNSEARFATIEEFWHALTTEMELAQYTYQVQLPSVTSNATSRSFADEKTKDMPIIVVQDMQKPIRDTTQKFLTRLLLVLILFLFIIIIALGARFFL